MKIPSQLTKLIQDGWRTGGGLDSYINTTPFFPTKHRHRKKKEEEIMDKSQTPHIVILPSPGMGHLIPLAEFAKRLVHQHNFCVTFLTLSTGVTSKAQKAYVSSLPQNIRSVELPPAELDDLPPDAKIETRISLTVLRSLTPIAQVIKSLGNTTRLVALVVDLFGTDAFDVAREFNIDPYIFFPSTSTALSLALHLPTLDKAVSGEYRDEAEPIRLPGCIPIPGKDLLDPAQDRKNEAYRWVLHHFMRYREAKGIFMNSFVELEAGPIKALKEAAASGNIPPVYPVGPLVQQGEEEKGKERVVEWLEGQPSGSVLFVSFGSGGTLSVEQMEELALGLELSEQRFLWVVRMPSDKESNATFFSVDGNLQSSSDPLHFLPKGFLERTKGVGMVIPSWAPQIQVLSHESTGGFLTHCGWNSTLESVVHAIPLIAWPLYAEQKMNALILTHPEQEAVALKLPTPNQRGVVERHDIAKVVKALMEGEEGKKLRTRMRHLKDAAANALHKHGSSYQALSQVASIWNAHRLK